MHIEFHKYQSTGNHFILVDNRDPIFPAEDKRLIHKLCNRSFGIGADGLILLENSDVQDFKMVYFNADGRLGSFCGNGSRAIVGFAQSLGLISSKGSFEAYDGIHETIIASDLIQIQMADVQNGRQVLDGTFIDTGSPHYVEIVDGLQNFDVVNKGRALRHNKKFQPNGSNINFIEQIGEDSIMVRTYERGVEDETLSCGTGVTAAAIVAAPTARSKKIQIETLGGNLSVWFESDESGYKNIWLEGPTELVFSGKVTI